MNDYQIIITPDAEQDLIGLRDYIAYVLLSPDTAREYMRSIRKEIASLSVLPARHKLADEEPWRSRGLRKIMAKRFYVYYRIDEDEKKVYILNVICLRRDQLRALSRNETK